MLRHRVHLVVRDRCRIFHGLGGGILLRVGGCLVVNVAFPGRGGVNEFYISTEKSLEQGYTAEELKERDIRRDIMDKDI